MRERPAGERAAPRVAVRRAAARRAAARPAQRMPPAETRATPDPERTRAAAAAPVPAPAVRRRQADPRAQRPAEPAERQQVAQAVPARRRAELPARRAPEVRAPVPCAQVRRPRASTSPPPNVRKLRAAIAPTRARERRSLAPQRPATPAARRFKVARGQAAAKARRSRATCSRRPTLARTTGALGKCAAASRLRVRRSTRTGACRSRAAICSDAKRGGVSCA